MLFFVIRVNWAIGQLGINPRLVRSEYRVPLAATGLAAGNSPQEVALHIVAQLPLVFRMSATSAAARKWIRTRKINPRAPEVVEALELLGWSDLSP